MKGAIYTKRLCIALIMGFLNLTGMSQDDESRLSELGKIPDYSLETLDKKANRIRLKMLNQGEYYLRKLDRIEAKLLKKIPKTRLPQEQGTGSIAGFSYQEAIDFFHEGIPQEKIRGNYVGGIDSVLTSLKFLSGQVPNAIGNQALNNSIAGMTEMKEVFVKSDLIRKQLLERQVYLRNLFINSKSLKLISKYQRQVHYYQEQYRNYRSLLSSPEYLGKNVVAYAVKSKAFQSFFQQHSEIAELFPIKVDVPDSMAFADNNSLQTRKGVETMVDQKFGKGSFARLTKPSSSAENATSAISMAREQLDRLRSLTRINVNGSNEGEIPDFKVNNQKTKQLAKRLEFGTNFQTTRSSSILPQTADFGLSLGYKISQNATTGIGVSYILGLGQGIRDLAISHQGVGLRTFIDIRLKGSIWLAGGGEFNYRSAFSKIDQLKDYSAWQKSALIGLSKVIELRTALIRKTKVQLLYDFLSSRQVPRSQPVLFRIYYGM